jgi:hypothetical protein
MASSGIRSGGNASRRKPVFIFTSVVVVLLIAVVVPSAAMEKLKNWFKKWVFIIIKIIVIVK